MEREREILDDKAQLRLRLRHARRALSAELVRAASQAVVDRLRDCCDGELAIYAGVDGEIEVDTICDGSALYPRVESPTEIVFCRARRADLVAARGLVEPPADAPVVSLVAATAIIVPGLGFDRRGHRLGQGRGYYDRALKTAPAVTRIGVGHDFQLLDHVPTSDADEPVDLVITPNGVYPTGARPHVISPGGTL